MKFIKTEIEGLIIIEPRIFEDDRGYFFESYNYNEFSKNGIDKVFVQDNQSSSQKDVLRGLHFQNPPFAQAKLVTVIKGAVLDVTVDIRKNSPTYGENVSIKLSEQNKKMLYIPEGFAHGFLTLEDNTIFSYKCSNFYNKASEDSLVWNDPNLDIDWKIDRPILSEKDKISKMFNEFKSLF